MAGRLRSAQRSTSRVVWGLTAIGILTGWSLLFSNHGLRQLKDLNAGLEDLSLQAYHRIIRNTELRSELEALRTDRRALEEVTRATLGFVRDDEIVYVFRRPPTD